MVKYDLILTEDGFINKVVYMNGEYVGHGTITGRFRFGNVPLKYCASSFDSGELHITFIDNVKGKDIRMDVVFNACELLDYKDVINRLKTRLI